MFNSLINLTKNVVDVVVAPIEMAVDLTNAAVKPIADGLNEVVQEVKDISSD